MIIKEMFQKSIDRDIKGVIKVGQTEKVDVQQELEEYVVTRELQKHFADFFSSYMKGINGPTDKMGVWISGFFGSGKSHFLKILSYLLKNREVNGKSAIKYFEEDNKIADSFVLGNMKAAAAVPTDVVLFNIDSKSEMTGKQSKDAIVSVFLKVFNEMLGYCGTNPHLADLERQLTAKGKYADFKVMFMDIYGSSWEESRSDFDFIQDDVVTVLSKIGFMSEGAARNWCEKTTTPYSISIEDFAQMVQRYIESQGNNHHVVFLVDEVGQYVGDNSDLMLNLQTVTEDLGTACQGKAWIVVTSQQDIDSITQTKGRDFSKIQGRFDTRLSLSSANVDEVIRRRILEKNTTAEQTLELLYGQKMTIIKNLIVFNDGVEKKLYADDHDFATVYPFVPYQFNLLGNVLTSIRTHGASGKHLSEGERSMLALFKESAVKMMNRETGVLIPFHLFYDALHQFLDHSHKGVISRALDNAIVNPDRQEDCFTVNVLKTLFMVKYIKEITANLENITSLMIADIDTDRIKLKDQVEESLKVLIRQTLVQKIDNVYVFLTDEEQEINRDINNQNVEMAEVINKVAELIYEDIYPEKKYRYPQFAGRYNFPFNQFVDDRLYHASQNYDIGIRILTPITELETGDIALRMRSNQEKTVLVVLPKDTSFLDELQNALRIEKYLRLNATGSNALAKYEEIKAAKRKEMSVRNGNAKLFLIDALNAADVYVNGDKLESTGREIELRLNEAVGRLVDAVYHKLGYIDTPMNEANIRALLQSDREQRTLSLDGGANANVHALEDLRSFIAMNATTHIKTSLKSLLDRFTKAPYGFIEDDVEWLVAKLFKDGDISLTLNSTTLTLLNKTPEEIIRFLTKKEFADKLLTDRREKANEAQKKSMCQVMKELFGITVTGNDEDALIRDFQHEITDLLSCLKEIATNYRFHAFPGKKTVEGGEELLREIQQIQFSPELFQTVHQRLNDFLDLAEDLEPVKTFFAPNSAQKQIFLKALEAEIIYKDSKNFIADAEIAAVCGSIREILEKASPYADIPKLPELLNKFDTLYTAFLTEKAKPVAAALDAARARVAGELEGKPYLAEFSSRTTRSFEELADKLKACRNVALLSMISSEADALKVRYLNEFSAKTAQIEEEKAKNAAPTPSGKTPAVKTPVKKTKTVSIKTVNPSGSWHIDSREDAERYIAALRERILRELDDNTTLNIEF